jgi:uncharacterized membrane protein
MTEILFLVTIILGVIVFDLRSKVKRLERTFREDGMSLAVPEQPRRAAVIVDAPVIPPVPQAQPLVVPPEIPVEVQSAEPVPEPVVAPLAAVPEPSTPVEAATASPEAPPAARWEPDQPPPPPPAKPKRAAISFEDLFGRKLPIWAGGITLVVAAVLLVKYSIDAGLLSPVVRVVLGLLFGAGLIGGAEVARRKADLVQDARIAQALAGAGIGSFYAAILAAHSLYALISPGLAFAGLTAVTALAMGLALRFGAPTAVLGLVGGLATPAMVSSGEPNVPMLAGYLALVIGGITLLSRNQRWFWLGVSALAGGGGWTALLLVFGGLDQLSSLSVGLLILMLGLGLPIVASADRRGPVLQIVSAVIASLQLALLVATGGYAMLSWGLYALLSIAFIWLTLRMPALRTTVAVPLLTSLLLAATWPTPAAASFIAVIAGIALIFGGSALWRLWRADGQLIDAAQIVLTALGGFFVSYWQFQSVLPGEDMRFALIALGFAALPAAGASLGWKRVERQGDLRFAMLVLSSALLVVIAAILGLADWTIPISVALVAAIVLMIGEEAQDARVRHGALVYLGSALLALMGTGSGEAELMRLSMTVPLDAAVQALLRWAVTLAVTALFAWRFAGTLIGGTAQGVAAVLSYGLIAQFLPAPWLALAAALGMLLATEATRRVPPLNLRVAPVVLAVIAGLWALDPLGRWLLAGVESLAGDPVFVGELSSPLLALQRLLGPALIGTVALWQMRERLTGRVGLLALGQMSVVGLIGLHILYKQLFGMVDIDAFVRLGLAERTLWQILLIGGGIALWRLMPVRKEGLGLVGLGLAHNLFYSMLLHNPLWAEQAVGNWPVANLLLPACGIAFAGPALLERMAPALQSRLQRPAAILRMVILLLFALATLRQLFGGSILVESTVGPNESILMSVAAIALAIGYLVWGIRSGQRAWRIGSLLLMLVAVAKVFLLDASGLEGLLRIVSFLALGFSLIGIGWLYSRYLKPDTT